MNQEMLVGLARIKEVKRYLIGVARARELAEKQYLTPEERKYIPAYKNAQGQECNLRRLLRELRELAETYKESQEEFWTIKRAMEKKIRELRIFLSRGHAQLCEIEEKLNRPYVRRNMELVENGILQRNQEVLSELKKASEAVLRNAEILSSKLEVREMPQTPKTTFTAKEVRNSLSRQYRSLKEEHEEVAIRRLQLMMKRVTAKEVMAKAKNIFVDGGFKKLSVEQQAYKKALTNYEREKSEYQEREMIFKRTKWTNSAEKFQAQYYLKKEKIRLEETGRKLSATKIRLDRESVCLENLCQTEEAQEKIALIVVGIIRRNLKMAREYEATSKRLGELFDQMQSTKKRFKALDDNYTSLKLNRLYRVIQPVSGSPKTTSFKESELTAIIADALLGEEYAVQLVARSEGNNLEMDKDWEMMLDSDKDEFIRKKIVREL